MKLSSLIKIDLFTQYIATNNMKSVFHDCYDTAFELANSNDKGAVKSIYDLYQEQDQSEWLAGRISQAIIDMFNLLPNESKKRFCSRCFPELVI